MTRLAILPLLAAALAQGSAATTAARANARFPGPSSVLDILTATPRLDAILGYGELATFDSCFSLFNSTFVASKNGVVDGHKYADSVLQFNSASLDGINFQPKRIKLWPNGEVPLRLEATMSVGEQKLLGCAVRWFQENSCVRFRDAGPGDAGHLFVGRSDPRGGCFTEEMGFQGPKRQILNLHADSSCWEMGTIVHELFHVLGFAHEQQREDRDDYITIHHENVPTWLLPQFKKLGSELGIQHVHMGEYDYQSIMHYSRTLPQFGGKPLMSAKKSPQDFNNQLMGQRVAPTLKDKEKINLLYHCPVECVDAKDVCPSLCASDDRSELEPWLEKNCQKSCGYCGISQALDLPSARKQGLKVCELSEWTEWSVCSATCGPGKQARSRMSLTGEPGICRDKVMEENISCERRECQECRLSQWAKWSPCSSSCADEDGMSYRTRSVEFQPRGFECKEKLFAINKCSGVVKCPIDCSVGSWEPWGKCDAVQCLSSRTRFVHRESSNGGRECPSKFQSRVCNADCHRQGNLVNLGCLDESERCLLLSLKPLNYTSAWDECRSQGGHGLAQLDTLEAYYSLKARYEKFKRAFWLWTSNPACGASSGHWVGAKVTSSDDWFWVENERARDGVSFKRDWPSFDRRFGRIAAAAGPAVFLAIADLRFSNAGFADVKCGFICEFRRHD